MSKAAEAIVVFDGVCHLCNHWVDFILRHDRAGRLGLASMQSPAGRALVERNGFSVESLPTLLVVERGAVYTHTAAIFRVLGYLGRGWRLLQVLRLIPPMVRDPLYRQIARNRYRLFGRRNQCRLPDPAERWRFLEALPELEAWEHRDPP